MESTPPQAEPAGFSDAGAFERALAQAGEAATRLQREASVEAEAGDEASADAEAASDAAADPTCLLGPGVVPLALTTSPVAPSPPAENTESVVAVVPLATSTAPQPVLSSSIPTEEEGAARAMLSENDDSSRPAPERAPLLAGHEPEREGGIPEGEETLTASTRVSERTHSPIAPSESRMTAGAAEVPVLPASGEATFSPEAKAASSQTAPAEANAILAGPESVDTGGPAPSESSVLDESPEPIGSETREPADEARAGSLETPAGDASGQGTSEGDAREETTRARSEEKTGVGSGTFRVPVADVGAAGDPGPAHAASGDGKTLRAEPGEAERSFPASGVQDAVGEPSTSVDPALVEPPAGPDAEWVQGALPEPDQAETATARAPAEARSARAENPLLARWQADIRALASELRTEAGGWQRLRIHLDDDGGTVTLRARREEDRVSLNVAFSDPMMRQTAQASAERLHAALETQLGQSVDFSFEGERGSEHPAREHRAASSTSDSSRSTLPASSRTSAPPASSGSAREWIG